MVSDSWLKKFKFEGRPVVKNAPLKKVLRKCRSSLTLYDVVQGDLKDLMKKVVKKCKMEKKKVKKVLTHVKNRFLTVILKTKKSRLITGYYPEASKIRKHVKKLKLHRRPKAKIYGKEVRQNRDVAFFSDKSVGYQYSGQLMRSDPLTSKLKKLMKKINQEFNTDFNGILINKYKDGSRSIGKHSDSGTMTDVIGITLGAERIFRIQNKKTKEKFDHVTGDCNLVWMEGDFQEEFTHEIPKQARVKKSRISLTFRKHKK